MLSVTLALDYDRKILTRPYTDSKNRFLFFFLITRPRLALGILVISERFFSVIASRIFFLEVFNKKSVERT